MDPDTPDRNYRQILENRSLSPSFFKDSVHSESDAEVDKLSDEDVASNGSYEIDQDHCLTLFNILK